MTAPTILRTPAALRDHLAALRASGLRLALVPTMGALHEGHLSLVRLAREHADDVVVSIFVNPTQFAPHEDFQAYPRDEAGDVRALAVAGCRVVYAPAADVIYPPAFKTIVTVEGVSAPLEGAIRPHHFAGVATVVTKLMIQTAPNIAVFGEKDYQQLQVIRRLTADLDLPVEIVGAPIARATDGLALSSRNAFLTAPQRAIATALHRALLEAAARIAEGAAIKTAETLAVTSLVEAGFDEIDYFEVRRPYDLARLGPGALEGPGRILVAARLGTTRLIDNVAV